MTKKEPQTDCDEREQKKNKKTKKRREAHKRAFITQEREREREREREDERRRETYRRLSLGRFAMEKLEGKTKSSRWKKKKKKRTREQRGTQMTGERTGGFRQIPGKLRYMYMYKYIVEEKQIYRYLLMLSGTFHKTPFVAVAMTVIKRGTATAMTNPTVNSFHGPSPTYSSPCHLSE